MSIERVRAAARQAAQESAARQTSASVSPTDVATDVVDALVKLGYIDADDLFLWAADRLRGVLAHEVVRDADEVISAAETIRDRRKRAGLE